MAEKVVVFGNCQAESVASGFQSVPELRDKEHVYVRSYMISDEEVERLLSPDVREQCTLLFEQVTPLINLSDRFDFPKARRVTFGSLDFNLLWPLRADEKRAVPELPDFPFGRYTYGDRIINEVVAKGLTSDDGWHYYVRRSAEKMLDLKRLFEIERHRWLAAERNLDVAMSDVIFENVGERRLFWTYNHPNRETLCRFAGRILSAAGIGPDDDDDACKRMMDLMTWPFGENYHQPVHPLVAEQLGLAWWSPDLLYRRNDIEMPYETFVRRQIAWE